MANNGLSGPGNTIRHQTAIAEILYAFAHKTKTVKKYQKYQCLPELPLDKYIPDITIFKVVHHKYEPVVIFEFAKKNALKNDFEKCKNLIDRWQSLNEAFIVNIDLDVLEVHKIRRLSAGKSSQPRKDSLCETFKLDIERILEIL